MEPKTEPPLWSKPPDRPREPHASGPLFDWIERTDDPEFQAIRDDLEGLWVAAPTSTRAEFYNRLRSNSTSNFFSAHCELWFRSLFDSSGFTCRDPSSVVASSKPDWLLASDVDNIAIAECYVRLDSDEDERVRRMKTQLYRDTRARMSDKHLQIMVLEARDGEGTPSANRFAKFLDDLGKDVPTTTVGLSQGGMREHEYQDAASGWSFAFKAIRLPRPPDAPIPRLENWETLGVHWSEGPSMLTEAINRKAKQHNCELPVLLCFNWHDWGHEPEFDEVKRVVNDRSASMQSRGVYGLLWAPRVFPWGIGKGCFPTVFHWDAPELSPFLDVWSGASVDVSQRN